ncbi:hypothetical protein GCM10010452_14240 [Crossiella cryophila]
MTAVNGERFVDAGAGDGLHVPEGWVHGFANKSGVPASVLVVFAPGASRVAKAWRVPWVSAASRAEPFSELVATRAGGAGAR